MPAVAGLTTEHIKSRLQKCRKPEQLEALLAICREDICERATLKAIAEVSNAVRDV